MRMKSNQAKVKFSEFNYKKKKSLNYFDSTVSNTTVYVWPVIMQ